ncbi:YciI family protein [Paenibacillus hamazuiensis]|uniref:YciI family protein n=1 Tax=Paenibacillus hamazuiensis TaxID=2936508 RepID=UPI00200DA760|nr:YciI family protein [Paenibacillus hamazuiensis]
MMLTYESKEDFAARTDNGRKEQYWAEWKAYFTAMEEAGILAYPGNILQPGDSARTIRRAEGGVETEGPYAETKDQLSGYCVIDVPDINLATEWASRALAAVSGAVEIRPLW